jgi:hypothetical protein
VVELWFEGRGLEAVLAKSEAQDHADLPSGYVLSGQV